MWHNAVTKSSLDVWIQLGVFAAVILLILFVIVKLILKRKQ